MHVYGKILDAERSNVNCLLHGSGKPEAIREIGTLAPWEPIRISMMSQVSGILDPSLAF